MGNCKSEYHLNRARMSEDRRRTLPVPANEDAFHCDAGSKVYMNIKVRDPVLEKVTNDTEIEVGTPKKRGPKMDYLKVNSKKMNRSSSTGSIRKLVL